MTKNVVLCLDGTSNQFCACNTNVVRLYQALLHDPSRQTTYYHPGLGTMEAVGALTSVGRKVTKVLGLTLGYGLETDVARAYRHLVRNVDLGDQIYLFGFSRGAYTVRALAALVYMYGLVRDGNEDLVVYALRMQSALTQGQRTASQVFALAKDFKRTFAGNFVEIRFIGLWDTVSSVGWIANPLRLPFTADNPSVVVARHAVSIDERRAFFRSNLWRPKLGGGPRDLRQVWFPGDHCDVGGGHADGDAAAGVALRWMAREAVVNGLLLDDAAAPAALGTALSASDEVGLPLHDSLRGWWRLAEFIPKRHHDADGRDRWSMNLFKRRAIPEGSLVHRSAFDRPRLGAELPASAMRVE